MADTLITSVVNVPSDEIVNRTHDNAFTGNNTHAGTETFNGTVSLQGGLLTKITTVTDTYQILVTDSTIIGNKVSDFTITLPTAVAGQIFNIKNINTGIITLEGSGSDTIDGELNQTISQWENITVQCSAANYWVIL